MGAALAAATEGGRVSYRDSLHKTPPAFGPLVPEVGDRARRATDGCGQLAKVHRCGDCGSDYATPLRCHREWCPECGAKLSEVHVQRMARWLPKLQLMSSVGYFVIQFPKVSRAKYRSQSALSRVGQRVVKVLKACGYDRGLRRWHFFGDDGALRGWNPHLNVLVDGSFLPPVQMDVIKRRLRMVLGEPELIVNYSYTVKPAKMMHLLRYVTRATFRQVDWDPQMADEMCGFRATDCWGGPKRWSDACEPAWALEEKEVVAVNSAVRAFEKGRCPCCGGHLEFVGLVGSGRLEVLEELGGGHARVALLDEARWPRIGKRKSGKSGRVGVTSARAN